MRANRQYVIKNIVHWREESQLIQQNICVSQGITRGLIKKKKKSLKIRHWKEKLNFENEKGKIKSRKMLFEKKPDLDILSKGCWIFDSTISIRSPINSRDL